MKLITPFLTLILLSVSAVSSLAQTADPVIEKFIAAQAKREKGEEPEGGRKLVTGDLNHDGVVDTAVLYTIEGQNGSNNYIQYLAVFLQTKQGLVYAVHKAVGGKNRRDVELTSIENGIINLDTTGYGPKDPSCCPTIKGKTTFTLSGKILKEGRKTE